MKNPQNANVFPKNMRFSSQAKKPQKKEENPVKKNK
jgi:hypothetical protein